MVSRTELRTIARARLRDAEVLLAARRYEGSVYLCGYSVEIGLKARICRALKWPGFPSTNKEFEGYRSFKTHNLDVLLRLSGAEVKIRGIYFPEWSVVVTWEPDTRYRPIGTATATDATDMINSAKVILGAL
jgi:HEPN domain-containing protein